MRVKRPKTRTKCAHCQRKREPKFIEWHPGIWQWQCSDYYGCDRVIDDQIARAAAALILSKS